MDQIYRYNERLAIPDKVYTPINGVSLTSGLFGESFQNNVAFLEKLSVERAAYWFDRKLGRETAADPYRGHFEDNLKGQTAGMYLIGAGNTLRWQNSDILKKGVDRLVDTIAACAEPDGFLLPIPKGQFPTDEYPNYVRLLINLGLIAAGNSGCKKAFTLLRTWQDWVNGSGELRIARYLILGFQGMVAGTNVYTTPAGDISDITAAQENYEEDWRLAQFLLQEKDSVQLRRQPGVEPHAHGTELESLEGYLDLFRATGKYYYLHAVRGAWEMYRKHWQHPGGGIVMCEFADSYEGCGWLSPQKAYNELCCSSFWINLNLRLHRLFPDEEAYMAEIEKSLYNVVIANQQGTTAIRYFAHLDTQRAPGEQVTCCAAAGTRILSSLPEYVFSISERDLYVNLYGGAEISWQRDTGCVMVSMESDMPYGGSVTILVTEASDEDFAMHVRIPGWAAGSVALFLNGELAAEGQPGQYAILHRVWNKGDTLTFLIPRQFSIKKYRGADQVLHMERYSAEYGPILMAVRGELNYNKTIRLNGGNDVLQPEGDSSKLHFPLNGNPGYELVPYFEIEDETFTCFPLFEEQ